MATDGEDPVKCPCCDNPWSRGAGDMFAQLCAMCEETKEDGGEVDERTLSITCRKEGLDGVELVSVGALAYEQTINQMEVASKSGAAAVDVLLVGGGEAA